MISARSISCAAPLRRSVKALILSSVGAHTVFVRERRDEALGLLKEALSIAEELGLREIEAEALQFIGMARLDAGDEGGVDDIEKALAAAIELNSPVSLSCYGNLADMRRYFGSLKASATLHLDGERAAEHFGIPLQVRRFRGEQACDLYYSGDWDEAVAHVEEYLECHPDRLSAPRGGRGQNPPRTNPFRSRRRRWSPGGCGSRARIRSEDGGAIQPVSGTRIPLEGVGRAGTGTSGSKRRGAAGWAGGRAAVLGRLVASRLARGSGG